MPLSPPGSLAQYQQQYTPKQLQGPGTFDQWRQQMGGLSSAIDPNVVSRYQGIIQNQFAPIDYSDPAYGYGMQNAGAMSIYGNKQRGIRGPYSLGAAQQAQYNYGTQYAGNQMAQRVAAANQAQGELANYQQQGRGIDDAREQAARQAWMQEVGRIQGLNAENARWGLSTGLNMRNADVSAYNANLQDQASQALESNPGWILLNMLSPGSIDRQARATAGKAAVV